MTWDGDEPSTAWPSGDVPPPPPSAQLLAVASRPSRVRPRAPLASFLLLLAAAAVIPVATLVRRGPRPDLPALPVAWIVVMAVAWSAAAIVPLALAVLPRRRQVLPNAALAFRAALGFAAAMVVLGLVATVDAPGTTRAPTSFFEGWRHCAGFGVEVTVPALVVAAFALRRLHPLGERRIAAALGAAFGALAGLTLHFVCAIGGGLHVGLAHGGGVVIGAVLGALLFSRPLRA